MSDFVSNLNDALFNAPFWIGLFSVGAFAYSRFDVSLPDLDELSPPLRPRSFTTAFRFWHAACSYFAIYALLYLGLLIVGTIPELRELLFTALALPAGTPADARVGTPAWAALVATAVLPAMPFVSSIDERLRLFLQDFASIPTKARMLAQDVLEALRPAEPPDIDEETALDVIVAAIRVHKERSERIFDLLDQLVSATFVAPGVGRRYETFFHKYQKVIDGFRQSFVATSEGYATKESARSVERKYHSALRNLTRFAMCAMLQAETTELGARTRLYRLGVKVPIIGIEFRPGLIVLNFFAIFFMMLVGSYVSASVYFLFAQPHGYTFSSFMQTGTGLFFLWSASSILFYTLPVVFAAGATMYVLDRKATALENDAATLATAGALTFLGSAVVSLFILLPTVFILKKVHPNPQTITFLQLLPWVIPPALMATTFMYMSSSWQTRGRWISVIAAYVLFHAAAATVATLLAWFLWKASGGIYDPKCCNDLPENLFLFLVPTSAGAIGAGVGWVLVGTRKEARAADRAAASTG